VFIYRTIIFHTTFEIQKNVRHSQFVPLSIRKKSLDLQNLHHATLGEVPDGTGDIRVFSKFEAHYFC
jgi:hypothetical protein